MLSADQPGIARARSIRRQMSLPEVMLWQQLRQQPGGLKFRRQHPSGPYVADFYCHEARLIVEVDGRSHDVGGRPERDIARDTWFAARGLSVVRLPAAQVLRDPASAVATVLAATARQHVKAHIRAEGGTPPALRATSPARGGFSVAQREA